MAFGSDSFKYEVQEDWWKIPDGWSFGWIPAVACDSQDRVYVHSRSEHPMVVFDREGNFLQSWGEEIYGNQNAHGIFIDSQDNLWTTEWLGHCVRKVTTDGEVLMTIGNPGVPGERDGDPFNRPTDAALSSKDLFISDGYVNSRVHKYTTEGKLLKSWGTKGDGPGQFNLSHCVRVDRNDRVWVCDRENNRIQIFNDQGEYITEWTGLMRPDTIFFDPDEDVVYIAELQHQVSIYTLDGELITKWGGGEKSDRPGEFAACPHGIWRDSRGDLYVGEVQADGRLQKFVRV